MAGREDAGQRFSPPGAQILGMDGRPGTLEATMMAHVIVIDGEPDRCLDDVGESAW